MNKATLRKSALKQRAALTKAEVTVLSLKLLEQFSALDFKGVTTLHIFLPIEEKNEPDTFLFVEWLMAHHPAIRIIVPRADFDTALMVNHVYPGREALHKNLYNILEPQRSEVHTGDVQMVIVPLLAFDRRGYRAGYGKGFYDRFLRGIETQKIGLSFFGPVDTIDDVHENDIRLDACITPDGIYRFQR